MGQVLFSRLDTPHLMTAMAMVGIAGLIRGFTGFGFSIAAVPLLSLVTPPVTAVPIVLLLQFAVSLSGLREAARFCHWRSVRGLAIGAAVATPVGTWGLAHLPAGPVRLCIAAIVMLTVIVLASGVQVGGGETGRFAMPVGLASGLFNGLAGMPGPPVIAYYLVSPITTGVARASMIVFFLGTSMFALAPAVALHMVDGPVLLAGLCGLPAVWAGSVAGSQLYRRCSGGRYRSVALILLVITAVLAAARALIDLV